MAVTTLKHPNVVTVYSFGCLEDRLPYMVMEYLEGVSLADLLKQKERLTQEEALPIFCQTLDALEHAHKAGIIHRDLKPSNIMLVGSQRTVKIVDFGIAMILPETGPALQKLTQTGALIGTVTYMSPEQCSAQQLDARSDVYSMGCLMYETLDGQPPIQGDSPYSTLAKQVQSNPRQSNYLSGDFGRVIFSALQKDRAFRPASALELKEALLNPSCYRSPIYKQRRGKLVAGGVALLLVVIALGVLAVFVARHLLEEQQRADREAFDRDMTMGKRYVDDMNWTEAKRAYDRALSLDASRGAASGISPRAVATAKLQFAATLISGRTSKTESKDVPIAHRLLSEALPLLKPVDKTYDESYAKCLQLLEIAATIGDGRKAADLQKNFQEWGKYGELWLAYEETAYKDPSIRDPLANDPTHNALRRIALANLELGELYVRTNRFGAALPLLRRAESIASRQDRKEAIENIYYSRCYISDCLIGLHRYLEAEPALEQVLIAYDVLYPQPSYERGVIIEKLADCLNQEGKLEAASASYRRAIAIYEEFSAQFPKAQDYVDGASRKLKFTNERLLKRRSHSDSLPGT